MFLQHTKWSRFLLVFFWILVYILIFSYLIKNINLIYYYSYYNISYSFILKLIIKDVFTGKLLFVFLLFYISLRYIKIVALEVIDSLIDYIHSYIMWVYVSISILLVLGTFYIYLLFFILS